MRHVLLFFVVVWGVGDLGGEVEVRVGSERRVELAEVRGECELAGRLLVRKMQMVFRNRGGRAAEGELVCPLDVGERVVSYAMDVGGVRREGVIVPAKAGREAYEEIVRRQVDPGILEVDEEKGEFRTRVFPIPKEGTKTVWITTLSVVGEGPVRIWREEFGRPGTWSLTVQARGGHLEPVAGDWRFAKRSGSHWEAARTGNRTVMPGCEIGWVPDDGVLYGTKDDEGGWWMGRIGRRAVEETRTKESTVALWWDGSCAVGGEGWKNLEAFLAWLENGVVRLQIFRNEAQPVETFVVKEGSCAGLLARLRGETRRGMARPGVLQWQAPESGMIALFTDGEFPEGPGVVGRPEGQFHVIDAGGGGSRWLRSRALASGGGWHAGGRLDPLTGRGNLRWPDGEPGENVQTVRGVFGDVVAVAAHRVEEIPAGEEVMETPAARWMWAAMMSAELRASGIAVDEIEGFNRRHGVMDGSTAWLVLETAGDYAKYGFEPPLGEVRLREEWRALLEGVEVRKKETLQDLAARWLERCNALEEKQPAYGDALIDGMSKRLSFWTDRAHQQDDLGVDDLRPMIKLLGEVEELTGDGVDAADGRRLMGCVDRLEEIEGELRKRLKLIPVSVGGQVRKPGRIERLVGSTLYDAVMAAGGPTEFGALNRVKLYRTGKVYTYDLRNATHREVRVRMGDVIDVPQKMWFGNGGGAPGQKPPFAPEKSGPPAIRVQLADWDPDRPYVKVLDEIMKGEGDWMAVYDAQRMVHGGRADFYLDSIELMERRGHRAEARRVAGELAELDPQSVELLRRAARALRRLGAEEPSRALFGRILALAPDDVIAQYDMARAAVVSGEPERAAGLLWRAVTTGIGTRRSERSLVFLEELNALLLREGLDPDRLGVDPLFVRHVPLDLRVVLEWDAEQCNVDLFVDDPMGNPVGLPRDHVGRGSFHSGNISRGYGPEVLALRRAMPGNYRFKARFFGDWNESYESRVTAELEVIRGFGTAHESRARHAIRLGEKEDREVLLLRVVPPGWE